MPVSVQNILSSKSLFVILNHIIWKHYRLRTPRKGSYGFTLLNLKHLILIFHARVGSKYFEFQITFCNLEPHHLEALQLNSSKEEVRHR
jgi:hypothetical protein